MSGKQETAGSYRSLSHLVAAGPAAGLPLQAGLVFNRARLPEAMNFYFCAQHWSVSLVRVKAIISQSCQYFRNQ